MENQLKQKIIKIIGRHFIWFSILLGLIILVLGYVFIIVPGQNKLKEDNIVNSRAGEYLSLKRQLDELNQLSQAYADISATEIARIDKFLPAKGEIEELMKQMEVIVNQNGLFLANLSLSEGSVEKNIGKIQITMSIIGTDYSGLKSLLYTIESNLRLLDVINLNFDPNSKTSTLNLVAYYQK